jgi:hypothetical protein
VIARLAFVLAVLFACATQAQAAVAVVHVGSATGGVGGSLSASLSGAPTNRNIVTASGFIGVVSRTVEDSNAVALTVHASTLTVTNFSDYAVIGGPTATYTATASAVIDLGLIELSGATLASSTYCNANSATCSVTGLAGDIIVCDAYSTDTTLTISNAGSITYVFQDATNSVAMGYATSTGGVSVCGGTGSVIVISGADYTAGVGGYFGAPGMTGYRGDPVFEQALALL